jgi:hypothetical protein
VLSCVVRRGGGQIPLKKPCFRLAWLNRITHSVSGGGFSRCENLARSRRWLGERRGLFLRLKPSPFARQSATAIPICSIDQSWMELKRLN